MLRGNLFTARWVWQFNKSIRWRFMDQIQILVTISRSRQTITNLIRQTRSLEISGDNICVHWFWMMEASLRIVGIRYPQLLQRLSHFLILARTRCAETWKHETLQPWSGGLHFHSFSDSVWQMRRRAGCTCRARKNWWLAHRDFSWIMPGYGDRSHSSRQLTDIRNIWCSEYLRTLIGATFYKVPSANTAPLFPHHPVFPWFACSRIYLFDLTIRSKAIHSGFLTQKDRRYHVTWLYNELNLQSQKDHQNFNSY
jgi:hypothetical protein